MTTQKTNRIKIVKGGGPGFYDLIILPRNKIAPKFTLFLGDKTVTWACGIKTINILSFATGACTFIGILPSGIKIKAYYDANIREGWMEEYSEEAEK